MYLFACYLEDGNVVISLTKCNRVSFGKGEFKLLYYKILKSNKYFRCVTSCIQEFAAAYKLLVSEINLNILSVQNEPHAVFD